MVHNELQYEFIYQYVHHWFNKLGIDDTKLAPKETKITSAPKSLQLQEEQLTQDEPSENSEDRDDAEGESNRSMEIQQN